MKEYQEYVEESLDDIKSTINYVLGRLRVMDTITKEGIDKGAFSFIDMFCDDISMDNRLKKCINKLYSDSIKPVTKYNKLIKGCYTDIVDNGVVFYTDEGLSLDDLSKIPLYSSAYTTLKDFNNGIIDGLTIHNYVVMYKLIEDVVGYSKFRVNGVNYIHCFSVSLEDDCVFSLLLVGTDSYSEGLGLNAVLCDRVVLCGSSKSVICKKVLKDDIDCVHRRFLNILNFINSKVMGVCMPDEISSDVDMLIKQSIVLRDNAKIVSGRVEATPTVVVGVDGEVTILEDSVNIVQLTRSY